MARNQETTPDAKPDAVAVLCDVIKQIGSLSDEDDDRRGVLRAVNAYFGFVPDPESNA